MEPNERMSWESLLPTLLRLPEWITWLRKKRLLIVDDSATDRELLRLAIEECGFRCATAASGEEALAIMRERRYHIVLADWNLLGITGWELIKRARDQFPKLRAILVIGTPMSLAGLEPSSYVEIATKPLDHEIIRRIMR